jgi:CRP/FNR family transcriptional regulator, cyclic AMP receptor protein
MRSTHYTNWCEYQPRKPGQFFNFLAASSLAEFRAFVSLVRYPAHALLFEEHQQASRMLVLVEGCAKLSVNSSEGKRLILGIARPVELLGLASVLSGNSYEMTAETVHACRIASICRQEFLDFLKRHPRAYQGVASELSMEMSRTREQMRILGLSSSASTRLAWLLLQWSTTGRATAPGTSVSVSLTHEEMGECIGVTRETVSRAMTDLRQRRLIDVHRAAITITSRFALESFAQGKLHRTLTALSLANRVGRSRLPGTLASKVTEITAGRRA